MSGKRLLEQLTLQARCRQQEYKNASGWLCDRSEKLKTSIRNGNFITDYPTVFFADMQCVHMKEAVKLQDEVVRRLEEAARGEDLIPD